MKSRIVQDYVRKPEIPSKTLRKGINLWNLKTR